jgi:hypothetical protein
MPRKKTLRPLCPGAQGNARKCYQTAEGRPCRNHDPELAERRRENGRRRTGKRHLAERPLPSYEVLRDEALHALRAIQADEKAPVHIRLGAARSVLEATGARGDGSTENTHANDASTQIVAQPASSLEADLEH